MRSATPNLWIAATVSPPPAIENAPDAATASASARVPAANASISKTPTGPFQTIVPALATISFSTAIEEGPMSRIMSSGSTSSTAFSVGAAVGVSSFAQTTSTGIGTLPGQASRIDCASGTRSGSTSDLPTWPCAARMNVFAMPPPTTSTSTFAASAFRTVSLVDTFDPPTTATSGRAGCASARPSASSSAAISGPAQATFAWRAIPCVVASARWAVPNASLT